MPLSKDQMQAALNALRNHSKDAIEFMQKTHASDHLAPTHTRPGGMVAPKSFYMKSGATTEQQGTKIGTVGWGGKQGEVKNTVTVTGNVMATKSDEAIIAKSAMQMTEYMLIDDSDSIGGLLLMVTGIPGIYTGFSYTDANVLPEEVYFNVLVIRATGISKLLSTYPSDMGYIDRKPGARYTIT